MAIRYAEAPDTDRIVAAALGSLADLTGTTESVPAGGQLKSESGLSRASVSKKPLPVYSLALGALAGSDILAVAPVGAWRLFVLDERNEPLGMAEVSPPDGIQPARLIGYAQEGVIPALGRALSASPQSPDLPEVAALVSPQRNYEIRLLEIPGLNTSSLWLKDLTGCNDRMIPLEPVPRYLKGCESYSSGDFLDLARSQASARLRFDDAPVTV